MKIERVRGNNRRRAFEVTLPGRGTLFFPYARSDPPPSPEDPIVSLFIDPELGNEGLTYRLRSGQEGSVLADHVLEYNRDPSYMRDLLLHQLTVEAKKRLDVSGLGMREVARRLSTSPAQLYRLLDTTNYRKTVDRMLELLAVLDADVRVEVR